MTQTKFCARDGKKTRIARFLLPSLEAQSALLPSDRWIMATVRDLLATNAALRRDVKRTALYTGGAVVLSVAALAGVVAGGVMFPALLPAVIAGGAAVLAGAAACGYSAKKALSSLRQKTLPDLRQDIMARYVKMKGNELTGEWARRVKMRKQQRAQEDSVADKERPHQAPVPEVQPVPADTKPVEKKSIKKAGAGSKLGAWALKAALDKVKKPDSGTPADKAKPPVPEAGKPTPPKAAP